MATKISKYTRAVFEQYLNETLTNQKENLENYFYLCHQDRGFRKAQYDGLERSVKNNRMGYIIRKKDPLLFNTLYNDWIRK